MVERLTELRAMEPAERARHRHEEAVLLERLVATLEVRIAAERDPEARAQLVSLRREHIVDLDGLQGGAPKAPGRTLASLSDGIRRRRMTYLGALAAAVLVLACVVTWIVASNY